jgi:hypothetical protein
MIPQTSQFLGNCLSENKVKAQACISCNNLSIVKEDFSL